MAAFAIRDALPDDIPACLALDHRYTTDYVWQMHFQNTGNAAAAHWQISFKTDRLPRTLEVLHPANEARLQRALHESHAERGFIVATAMLPPDDDDTQPPAPRLLGYLTLYADSVYRSAHVQDLVIDRPLRRRGLGRRLLNVARAWARERHLNRLTIETQPRNDPSIQFCQSLGLTFCGFNDHHFPNQETALFFTRSV
jgi:GNAT superfamily N-acetyltransferase